jgi:hypothetical protein
MVATPSLIYSLPQAGPRVPRGHAGAAGNQTRLNTSQRTTSLTTTVSQFVDDQQVSMEQTSGNLPALSGGFLLLEGVDQFHRGVEPDPLAGPYQ